jgi:CxxC motif-containing protein
MKRELTCIACPLGCQLVVTFKDGKIDTVEGFTCKRGREYAINECTSPVRTVTTTVKCSDGSLLPVKTDKPIPKDKMMEAMKIINSSVATLPVKVGDIIIKDLFGSNVVATQERE